MRRVVRFRNRTFIVERDVEGNPLRITERKRLPTRFPNDPGRLYNAPYWHRKFHRIGGPKTIVSQILKLAEAKP